MDALAWTQVEDALVGALTARLGSEAKVITSYQGNWRKDLREEAWRLPAVLVMLSRSRAEQITGASFDLTLDFQVLVVVRRLRGEAAGRRDPGGAYDLLRGVREALWHRDLGLEVLPLALVREEPLQNDGEFTVYAAHYRTTAIQDC